MNELNEKYIYIDFLDLSQDNYVAIRTHLPITYKEIINPNPQNLKNPIIFQKIRVNICSRIKFD